MGKAISTPRCYTCNMVMKNKNLNNRCAKCAFDLMREPLVPKLKPRNQNADNSHSIRKLSALLGVSEHQVEVQLKDTTK